MLEFSGSVRRPAACAGRLAVQFDKSVIRESRWFGPSAARANRRDEKKPPGSPAVFREFGCASRAITPLDPPAA
ncbi:hypothetical protein I6G56_16860 [Burkholderia humptydooensis]|uniref:Uncharacterized protein n=1 Tax=Burkholderia humptydooensis TaxID=430531 RepID=A0A7T2U4P7_9BURK|nr:MULTISPECIES: hypothetical protein [Burkholderia]QPS45668.1 hypothetical protein I6G56_16860 [Burkholderia humptydooensis]